MSMRFIEILLVTTFATGMIVLINRLFLRPHRNFSLLPSGPLAKPASEPWWIATSQFLFPVLLMVLLLRAFVAEPFKIPSGSMKPTLLEGDHILVTKFNYGLKIPFFQTTLLKTGAPQRGEVIVFRHSQEIDMIKRVVGIPGDRILYQDNILYINGKPMPQQFLHEQVDAEVGQTRLWPVRLHQEQLDGVSHQIFIRAARPDAPLPPYQYNGVKVPEQSYFVMGDNRNNSHDSRYWGFVSEKDIIGKALAVYLSWDSHRPLWDCVRWRRAGQLIH